MADYSTHAFTLFFVVLFQLQNRSFQNCLAL